MSLLNRSKGHAWWHRTIINDVVTITTGEHGVRGIF
jgi:hypothetical protein